METQTHGFRTREEWTKWFTDYNRIISELSEASYALVQSDLPADQWVSRYQENSANMREAFRQNEEMLEQHVRWFTRTPGRWTREVADPLLEMLFRYVTRMQDLGAVYEIADSLLALYTAPEDELAVMKCRFIRACACAFLDSIHLAEAIHADCAVAAEIYERRFPDLTPEEQSMGLSIYDLEFDRLASLLKLGKVTSEHLEQIIAYHTVAIRAVAHVVSVDKSYRFNNVLPDFDHLLGFWALCLRPGQCTPAQAQAILQAAERRHLAVDADATLDTDYRVRTWLVYRMAQRLLGRCADEEILADINRLMGNYSQSLLAETRYSQHAAEAVEAIQLATENLTDGGKREPALYDRVQAFFIGYLSTRPYTTFVDYVCASLNYCYILTALPHLPNERDQLQALLQLTMFRQVQTAMHTIMVSKLALEILDSLISRRPELLTGRLGTRTPGEVQARREEFRSFLYRGAMLHDIGKVLCSSVINAQSHRLGDLEFQVLKFHPVTGGEMLEQLPELSVFRDIAVGHQKSFDGAFGYPASFDNTASPLKIFIDIITVCDSLDAATDHLGRNYATAKDFDTVLSELRAGSGSRYSGELVSLLDADGALRRKLRHLLEEGRREVYYDVHNLILTISSARRVQEKTQEWLLDPELQTAVD